MFQLPLCSKPLPQGILEVPREKRLTVRELWRTDVDAQTKKGLTEKARFVPRVGNPRSLDRNIRQEALALLIPARSLDAIPSETSGRDKSKLHGLYDLLRPECREEIDKMADSVSKIEHIQVAAILHEHGLLDAVLEAKEKADPERPRRKEKPRRETRRRKNPIPRKRKAEDSNSPQTPPWWNKRFKNLPFQPSLYRARGEVRPERGSSPGY